MVTFSAIKNFDYASWRDFSDLRLIDPSPVYPIIEINVSLLTYAMTMQGLANRRSPDLVNFVTALAYHFCLALPAAFTQPGDHLLA